MLANASRMSGGMFGDKIGSGQGLGDTENYPDSQRIMQKMSEDVKGDSS